MKETSSTSSFHPSQTLRQPLFLHAPNEHTPVPTYSLYQSKILKMQQNPDHWYNKSGDYSVTLIAFNIGGIGNNLTKNGFIRGNDTIIMPPPAANFTTDISTGISPLTNQFIDNSTGTLPLPCQWSFGDGLKILLKRVRSTSSMQQKNQTYPVILTTSKQCWLK